MKNLKDYIIESATVIPQDIINLLKHGIRNGYINMDGVKYGVSKENIHTLDMEFDHEAIEKVISKLEADGIKFKYEKDEEWKKAGFKDPNED